MEIRTGTEKDASDIVRLLELCYGDSYPVKELYDPRKVEDLLAGGDLRSTVAVEVGRVVGHYSLAVESPLLGIT